jgi:hypothetical protein
MTRSYRLLVLSLSLIGAVACPHALHGQSAPAADAGQSGKGAPASEATPANIDMTELYGKAWRITAAPSEPPAGSIYVFMANGTLLETSCVETYRIATWTADSANPRILHVVEDKRPAFTATITQLTATTLRMQQRPARSRKGRSIAMAAVAGEYVCSDLPK